MSKRSLNEGFVDERPSKSLKVDDGSPFANPWKGSNAVLVVEDIELHVHTQTLSLASPVFEAMFNGNFVEAQTRRVPLEGKSYEAVEHMLKLVYNLTNRLEPKTLACLSCKLGETKCKKDKKGRRKSYFNGCYLCGLHYKKNDLERRLFIQHLVLLNELSKEYMLDVLVDKIQAEIVRQSKVIANLQHAFDILEASEKITDCMEIAASSCIKHIRLNLDSYGGLKDLLNERSLTIETILKMKSIVLINLLEKWPESNLFEHEGNQYKKEAMLLAKELCD